MDELKRKVKVLIPEEKHLEIDKIFCDWIASLKVHTILEKEGQGGMSRDDGEKKSREGDECREKEEKEAEKPPLKSQIEELKQQIGNFKRKMKMYKESGSTGTDLALVEVKEEIGRVREGILKMRMNFTKPEESEKDGENVELIQKLDEVKQFLEKLK